MEVYFLPAYKPPLPPFGSGPHRYFFLLYEQNYHIGKIDDSENNMAVRCGFNVRNFAEDNSMIGPVALNMFVTERNQNAKGKDESDEEKDKIKSDKKDEQKEKDSKAKTDKGAKEGSENDARKDQKKDEKKIAKKKDLI